MDFAILPLVHPTGSDQNEINRYKWNRSCAGKNEEKFCVLSKLEPIDIVLTRVDTLWWKVRVIVTWWHFLFFFWSPSFDIRNLIFILLSKKCVERFFINFGFEFVYIQYRFGYVRLLHTYTPSITEIYPNKTFNSKWMKSRLINIEMEKHHRSTKYASSTW